MAGIVREGDMNEVGGIATGGSMTVFADGAKVMLPGNPVSPHVCCGSPGCSSHCSAKTTGGSSTVFVDGMPVITNEDMDTCGHKRLMFSPTVSVGT